MKPKITIRDLREHQLTDHVQRIFKIRLFALPFLGAAILLLGVLDGDRLRVQVIALAFAFEFLVAVYYFWRSKIESPLRDIIINVVAVALGGVSVLYVTGDIHSPVLPMLILPATLIGGVFGRGPIRFLVLFPIVGFIPAMVSGMLGWIPRFEPLLSTHPDWQSVLRATVIGAIILQTWRITGWLTEDVLQLARKVESAYDDLGKQFESQQRAAALFVSQLAHELRNPLASVKGLAELIRDHPEADNAQHLRIITDEIRRLESTLDATLSFARPAPLGAMAYFDVRESMQSALRILDGKIKDLGVDVFLDWPEDLLLKGDEQGFRQVFFNLIGNALKAMPSGGKLSITGRRERGGMDISVRDTGSGIPAELRDKVFEPYVSGDADGTGLGLSIVRQIVQAHGGTVAIGGGEGRGASVEIRLPME